MGAQELRQPLRRADDHAHRSEEHTSELQSLTNLVCRLLLESEEHTSELQSLTNIVCRLLLAKKITPRSVLILLFCSLATLPAVPQTPSQKFLRFVGTYTDKTSSKATYAYELY